MTVSYRRIAAIAALSVSVATTVYAQRSRIHGPIDNGRRITLAGRVPLRARRGTDLGRVAGNFQLPAVTILLKPSATQQTDLAQLLRDQQDPASPNYHKWLTPEQYGDLFGASQADVDQITAWLQSQGFNIVDVARSRTFITVSGTADQAGNAFQTEIHQFRVNGRMHYANTTDPSVPAALAPLVAGIRGLHDFHPKPRLRAPTPNYNRPGGAHALAPADIATIYNIKPLYDAGVDGTGQKIAVVGQSEINQSDIQSFRTKFGLSSPNLQPILAQRPTPGVVPGDQDESNLDVEWAGAAAPNATVVFVYSNDVWTSAFYAIDQNVAPVLSMSYGTCEQSDLVDIPSFQQAAQQANAEGMTFISASGDAGAADCEDPGAAVAQNGLAVDVPAAIPEVTAMGGTEFAESSGGGQYWALSNDPTTGGSALSYIPETVWNTTTRDGQLSASGGGASMIFPRPLWQNAPGVPTDGARHVPDVSFSASNDHDPYYVFSAGSGAYFGGTSAGAPVMAGVVALLNQYLTSTGAAKNAGLGNINPTLYRLAQSTPAVFHQVTTGDNAVPCAFGTPDCTAGTIGYKAQEGYNMATGLGSLDVAALVHGWSGAAPRNSAVVPSIDQNPVFQQPPDLSGSLWSFHVTLTEEAGIATTLKDFTIDGVSYASQIPALFGSAAIPADGSITAKVGLKSVAVPKTVVFTFSGVDADGTPWTTQMNVPFQGVQPQLAVAGATNAASYQQGFAPGMIMAVFGSGLGLFPQAAGAVPLPQYLAGFEATVCSGTQSAGACFGSGTPAPIYYVSPGQVNVQIPYETQPGPATLVVGNPYTNVAYNFQVAATAPGIFTFQDGSINPTSTAARGQVATMYITGEGAVSPTLPTGTAPDPSTALSRLPKPQATVSITVGGVPVVQDSNYFVGIPYGLVGVTQINFTIPSSVPPGKQPVVVTVGNAASNPATITVQ